MFTPDLVAGRLRLRVVLTMAEPSTERTVPPWLYKLFTGHQYPYVRRLAKFENKDHKPGEERAEPTAQAVKAKFWEVFPRCC